MFFQSQETSERSQELPLETETISQRKFVMEMLPGIRI